MIPASLQRRLFRGLCTLLAVGVATFAVSVLPGVRPGAEYNVLLDGWLSDGLYVLATLIVGLRAVLRRQDRPAWACLAVGMASYTAGNIYYFVAQRDLPVVPIPSLADYLWVAFYPCAYLFVLLLVRRHIARFRLSVWLDGAVAGLGAAALAAAAVFGVVVTDTSGSPATVATNLAYPLGDLVLLTLIVGVFALAGWRADAMWWLAGTGMVAFAAADAVYLFDASRNAYHPGTWLDLMWDLGLALLAVAAVRHDPGDTERSMDGWTVLLVPSVFCLLSVALLAAASRRHLPMAAVILAVTTVLVAVARTWLTLHEVRQLADSRRLAATDDLTGLPNRRHFRAAISTAVAARGSTELAVLLMDLDRFKEINDSLGHHVGDQLLTLLGPRLRSVLAEPNLLARLGGDEYGVLLPGADAEAAAAAAGAMLTALHAPFDLAGVSLHIEASIGIALCPTHADGVSGLLQRADLAMYRAKASHAGYSFSHTDTDADAADRQRLQTLEDLRTGLDRDQLVLHYQPKLDLRTGQVNGVEALVRWQHPTRGLLYPDAFLPLAEASGLLRRLTLTVLEIALRQANTWRRDGRPLTVAVNLSASNLLDTQLPAQIEMLLTTLSLPATLLELEITETVLMADPVRALQVLCGLRALGVRLAVDDYGTGYSSLSYLQDLPVDDLKLDRTFVTRSETDPRSAAIVRSTIALAHSLDMQIIAEGVESATVLRHLAQADCDLAQGYHICPPQPATELATWLAAHATSTSAGTAGTADPAGTPPAPGRRVGADVGDRGRRPSPRRQRDPGETGVPPPDIHRPSVADVHALPGPGPGR
jgi:diguanylate cyclase (GGDEF)-like protein